MRHQSEKFFRFHHISFIASLVFGILAITQSHAFLYLLAFYALAFSFAFEGLAYHIRGEKTYFLQQILRAFFILVLATFFFF
ncbi:diacylglycerol kinase [Salirhabdus euzebyi]|uniref:Diacylglycerol kinase n=1 Tax=Salirhabdus euzebyi TaxID=394506 RepID=A0A841Q6A8_9BACI|nr:hypothetical protein [Salirhabdus euzebyi]MBB6453894.1 diacylglycerol kinase [Salirhabdus euzebyi]